MAVKHGGSVSHFKFIYNLRVFIQILRSVLTRLLSLPVIILEKNRRWQTDTLLQPQRVLKQVLLSTTRKANKSCQLSNGRIIFNFKIWSKLENTLKNLPKRVRDQWKFCDPGPESLSQYLEFSMYWFFSNQTSIRSD